MRIFLFLMMLPAAFGQLFSFGAKVGVPLTDALAPLTTGSLQTFSGSKNILIGPMIELHLPFGFSINADGLYRSLDVSFSGITRSSTSYASWEVTPALRYRFLHTPIVKPFAEAGPSFRFVASPLDQGMSDHGFTLGAGVEVKILRVRIAPELRFTRWGSDHNVPLTIPFQTGQNQAEFL